MNYLWLMPVLLLLQCTSYAQDKLPIELTPAIRAKLKQEVETEITAFRKKMQAAQESATSAEFAVDTFRIEELYDKQMELDYTTAGMREAGYEAANRYDSLMNKYYKKLATVLKGDDKKTLLQAQKAWLSFRDNETKLTETISRDEYSGGGTMQQLVESSMYLTLIKNRAVDLFNHYQRAIGEP